MVDASEIIENVSEFLSEGENKKKTVIIAAILIFMTLSAVVITSIQDISSKKKEKEPEKKLLVLDQKLLVPENTFVQDEYLTSRTTPDFWSEEEVRNWFTVPDKEQVEELGKVNDKIVNDILGAAQ